MNRPDLQEGTDGIKIGDIRTVHREFFAWDEIPMPFTKGETPMNQKTGRIVAVILSLLIAASVCVTAFAATGAGIPNTGDNNGKAIVIVVSVLAAAGLGAGIIIPRFRH